MSFSKKIDDFFVTCYNFYERKKYLILGDEFGNVSIWNCSKLMEALDVLHGENDEYNKKLTND